MLKKIMLMALAGLLSGAAFAIWRITHWSGADASIVNGSWLGQKLDNVGDDKLLTARIAIAALFALRPDETIYLIAKQDADGEPLSCNHEYTVSGTPPGARYWSVTLYDEDYFLMPNEINRFNFNMRSVAYESDSSFVIRIAKDKQEGNWLPCGEPGKFYLALRLYHPQEQLVKNIETASLPVIKKVK